MTHEYSTKCTGESGGGEEQSDTINPLVTLVPHTQVKDGSGGESTFNDTEEKTDRKEPREILGDAREGCHDTPDKGEGG